MDCIRSKSIHHFWGLLLALAAILNIMGAASVYAKTEQDALSLAVSKLPSGVNDPSMGGIKQIFTYLVMYDSVIGVDDEGNLDPDAGLAYKWQASPDYKTFTVWIRDGVKFHNGDDVTAQDVKFSMDRYVFDKNSKGADKKAISAMLDRIEVVEPNMVVYHLKKPSVIFWVYLTPFRGSCYVVPKDYTQKVGNEGVLRNPVGSGPYRFVKAMPASYFEYEAVEKHWRTGTPKFKKLRFERVSEEGTRVAMLKAGDIDAVPITTSRVDEAKGAGFSIFGKKQALGIGVHFMRQWYEGSPLGDPRVREALTLAVNSAEILKYVFKEQGVLTGNYPMGPMSAGYKEMPPIPFNPERAKQLLSEAKADYPKWTADGFPIHIHAIMVFPESTDVAQALAGYWNAVGLKSVVHPMEGARYYPIWKGKKEPEGLPGVALYGYSQRWSMVIGANQNWTTYGRWRHGGNAALDSIVAKLDGAPTMDAWSKAVGDIQQSVSDNFITLPIANVDEVWAVDPDVITEWNQGTIQWDMNVEALFRSK